MLKKENTLEEGLLENFRVFFTALYGELEDDDQIHESIQWEEHTLTTLEAILMEIERILGKGVRHGGENYTEIITLFFGLNSENPKRWQDGELAKKYNCKPSSVLGQRRYALGYLSLSPLLREFLG